jgi:hypothetical protein
MAFVLLKNIKGGAMTKYTYQKLADKFGHEHIVIGKNKVVKK